MSVVFDAVIFDLGGVVLGWDPYRAYENLLSREATTAHFEKIDFTSWNKTIDAGERMAAAEDRLLQRFPDDEEVIRAYRRNFSATLTGMVPGTAAIIAELQQAGLDLVGLSNWSDELFPYARQRFGILDRLRDIVVSGAEGMAKPDRAIFALTCDRFGLDPARTVFIDDVRANIDAARAYGLTGILFRDAAGARQRLVELGLLGPQTRPTGPVHHLAVRAQWESGDYPWSSRDRSYDAEGFVHCSYAAQVAGTRQRFYADLPDEDLVLLRLHADAGPIVVEDLGAGMPFPHLYAPLTRELVATEQPLSEVLDRP